MPPTTPSTTTLLIVLPLVIWRVYVRFRRMIGRQRHSKIRPWMTATAFPLLVGVLGYFARSHIERLESLGAGIVVGIGLGIFGLRRTRFEATPEGLFYTPNAHLGIALSLVFAGRIVFRLIQAADHGVAPLDPSAGFSSSPLTLAILGLLAGYYTTYAIGLIRWSLRVAQTGGGAEVESEKA